MYESGVPEKVIQQVIALWKPYNATNTLMSNNVKQCHQSLQLQNQPNSATMDMLVSRQKRATFLTLWPPKCTNQYSTLHQDSRFKTYNKHCKLSSTEHKHMHFYEIYCNRSHWNWHWQSHSWNQRTLLVAFYWLIPAACIKYYGYYEAKVRSIVQYCITMPYYCCHMTALILYKHYGLRYTQRDVWHMTISLFCPDWTASQGIIKPPKHKAILPVNVWKIQTNVYVQQ